MRVQVDLPITVGFEILSSKPLKKRPFEGFTLNFFNTLPETNMAPENGLLEDDPFLFGALNGLFLGAKMLFVSGRGPHDEP